MAKFRAVYKKIWKDPVRIFSKQKPLKYLQIYTNQSTKSDKNSRLK